MIPCDPAPPRRRSSPGAAATASSSGRTQSVVSARMAAAHRPGGAVRTPIPAGPAIPRSTEPRDAAGARSSPPAAAGHDRRSGFPRRAAGLVAFLPPGFTRLERPRGHAARAAAPPRSKRSGPARRWTSLAPIPSTQEAEEETRRRSSAIRRGPARRLREAGAARRAHRPRPIEAARTSEREQDSTQGRLRPASCAPRRGPPSPPRPRDVLPVGYP